MKIPYITWRTSSESTRKFLGQDINSRKIAVINGIPFYQSSGDNSKIGGTWEPFLGLETKNEITLFGRKYNNARGWLKKPCSLGISDPKLTAYEIEFPLPGNRPYARFATIPCMLISSAIGGGVWNTDIGKQLHARLKEDFPEFYSSFNIEMKDTGQIVDSVNLASTARKYIEQISQLNNFLIKQKASFNTDKLFTMPASVDASMRTHVAHDLEFPKSVSKEEEAYEQEETLDIKDWELIQLSKNPEALVLEDSRSQKATPATAEMLATLDQYIARARQYYKDTPAARFTMQNALYVGSMGYMSRLAWDIEFLCKKYKNKLRSQNPQDTTELLTCFLSDAEKCKKGHPNSQFISFLDEFLASLRASLLNSIKHSHKKLK